MAAVVADLCYLAGFRDRGRPESWIREDYKHADAIESQAGGENGKTSTGPARAKHGARGEDHSGNLLLDAAVLSIVCGDYRRGPAGHI